MRTTKHEMLEVSGQITFEKIAGTNLYQPQSAAADEKLLFLAVLGGGAAQTITLEATWGSSTPAVIGYYLFLNELPERSGFPAFEDSLKKSLPAAPPVHSSFAWVQMTSPDTTSVVSLLKVTLDHQIHTLTDDFVLDVPSPFSGLVISSSTPISPTLDEGFISGFVILYPAKPPFQGQPASQPPNGFGLNLPLTGEGVGCFRFEGLYNAPFPRTAASVVKDLYRVSIDPLDFFDDQRTYMTLTGMSFLLAKEGKGFSIQPL